MYLRKHIKKQISFLTAPKFKVIDEACFLQMMLDSPHKVELLAILDGKIIGLAGIQPVREVPELAHRADLGVSILKKYWHMGIGTALTQACIECAKTAGYSQIELLVVKTNQNAIALYKKIGFIEFGRNPKGFKTKDGTYQETIHMRLEL